MDARLRDSARHAVHYDRPGRHRTLSRDCKTIVATKEPSGNLAQIMAILRELPEGFRVLSGDDAVTLPLIALGADGLVSVASNEAPDLLAQMCDTTLAREWDAARAL